MKNWQRCPTTALRCAVFRTTRGVKVHVQADHFKLPCTFKLNPIGQPRPVKNIMHAVHDRGQIRRVPSQEVGVVHVGCERHGALPELRRLAAVKEKLELTGKRPAQRKALTINVTSISWQKNRDQPQPIGSTARQGYATSSSRNWSTVIESVSNTSVSPTSRAIMSTSRAKNSSSLS